MKKVFLLFILSLIPLFVFAQKDIKDYRLLLNCEFTEIEFQDAAMKQYNLTKTDKVFTQIINAIHPLQISDLYNGIQMNEQASFTHKKMPQSLPLII